MSIVAWSAPKWGKKVIRHEFDRETGSFYFRKDQFGREHRERKEGGYDRYFPSEQEALDFIAARDAARAEREAAEKAKRLLNDAAPDLLAALQLYVAVCGNTAACVSRESAAELYDIATAALAKATGGQ